MVDALRVRSLLDRLGAEIAALRRLAQRVPAALLTDEDAMAAYSERTTRCLRSWHAP